LNFQLEQYTYFAIMGNINKKQSQKTADAEAVRLIRPHRSAPFPQKFSGSYDHVVTINDPRAPFPQKFSGSYDHVITINDPRDPYPLRPASGPRRVCGCSWHWECSCNRTDCQLNPRFETDVAMATKASTIAHLQSPLGVASARHTPVAVPSDPSLTFVNRAIQAQARVRECENTNDEFEAYQRRLREAAGINPAQNNEQPEDLIFHMETEPIPGQIHENGSVNWQ
jgi:hypothetical protein